MYIKIRIIDLDNNIDINYSEFVQIRSNIIIELLLFSYFILLIEPTTLD